LRRRSLVVCRRNFPAAWLKRVNGRSE
jgi:hypothetical protein